MLKKLTILCLLLSTGARANPAEAERIKRGFELSSEKWILEMKLATTPEARQEVIAKRPDPNAAAAELWRIIAPDLAEDWIIPYAALFLGISKNTTITDDSGITKAAFVSERQRLLKTFSETHLKKPDITPFTIALIDSGEPQALSLLEKIATENPDEATQGIAALGAAMLLKSLGDEPELMAKRLNFLREAIIKSADQIIAGTSVADIASDELYVIRYLTKGREAPPLSGTDVAARPVKLSDFKGRMVILLFWDAKTEATDQIIQLTNQLATKYRDQPVTVLGVTPESAERIRTLQGDGSILWNNISDPTEKLTKEYRINNRPAVFVIDAQGKIQFTGLPGSFVELTVDALLNPLKK
ncbi:MAG: redoxin domain-containing protein [Verrucomicrobia bacterium]|jgi:peroxiredoxin|nr:redoxin domain-containing protein [Verrucomicrobiota bacterium]|tara:strand:- start:386 stop:1459 length:1074 start_codon:yes stop_codon:yes gene_type:complete